jgi:hypothetical protein
MLRDQEYVFARRKMRILDQACALVRNQRSQAFESWEYVQSRKVVLQVEIAALKVRISAVTLTILLEPDGSSQSDETPCRFDRVHQRGGTVLAFQHALAILNTQIGDYVQSNIFTQ